jgi:hypothetical protein
MTEWPSYRTVNRVARHFHLPPNAISVTDTAKVWYPSAWGILPNCWSYRSMITKPDLSIP